MAEEGEEVPPEPVPALSEEDFEGRKTLFAEIFSDASAQDLKQKSLAERKEKEIDGVKSLTYSELDISTIHTLLELVKEKYGPLFPGKGVFLDIGSGAGKACVAAGLLHPFEKVVGIEMLDCLNAAAGAANGKYGEAQMPEGVTKPPIEFLKNDFVMEFDAVMEPLAATTTMCLCVATAFGEEQMAAIAKFADKMPEGSVFITFTQELPESMLIDINRNPKLRRAAAIKKALATRGKSPEGVVIELEPAPNGPQGWKKVCCEQMELMWGTTSCYVFKKYNYPFCDATELCMATRMEEENDTERYVAKFVDATHVVFFDDHVEEPVEVGKLDPFTTEATLKVLDKYRKATEEGQKALKLDAKEAIVNAMKAVSDSMGGALAAGDKVSYALEPETVNKESQCLVENLLKSYPCLSTIERATRFMLPKFDEACKAADKEATGSVSDSEAVEAWNSVKEEYVKLIQGKLAELEEWQKAQA